MNPPYLARRLERATRCSSLLSNSVVLGFLSIANLVQAQPPPTPAPPPPPPPPPGAASASASTPNYPAPVPTVVPSAGASLGAPPALRPTHSWTGQPPSPLFPQSTLATAAPRAVEPKMQSNWYGWQTLLVDSTWVATFLLAANSDREGVLVGIGSLDYFFGAPIVHWAHGHVGTGFASLGLRTLPFVAGGVVLATGNKSGGSESSTDFNNLFTALIVMGVGVVAAVTIDAAVLAREDVPVAPVPDVVALGIPLYRIAPTSTITRTSGTVGVSAAF